MNAVFLPKSVHPIQVLGQAKKLGQLQREISIDFSSLMSCKVLSLGEQLSGWMEGKNTLVLNKFGSCLTKQRKIHFLTV